MSLSTEIQGETAIIKATNQNSFSEITSVVNGLKKSFPQPLYEDESVIIFGCDGKQIAKAYKDDLVNGVQVYNKIDFEFTEAEMPTLENVLALDIPATIG